MHVNKVFRTRHLMQRINVLCHDQNVARILCLKPGQRMMGSIWLYMGALPAPFVIEVQHQRWVATISLWRGDLAIVILGPDSVFVAERMKTGFRGKSCASQNDNVFIKGHWGTGAFASSKIMANLTDEKL